jgi:two-component system, sensor histidine kinase ChiS
MPTVLVIDENRATLDTIGRALVDAGFSIVLASTGSEGLRLAAARTIDLVVADLRLPDGTDVEVLKQLRQTLTNVPVLVTGLASTASAIEAGKLGAVDYIEKPVFTDHLVQVVRAYVPQRPAAPPHQAPATHDRLRVSPQVIRAMHTIEGRYVEADLHVRAVAQELGVSTEHLCRVLKRHTGLTFVTLLRRTRVRAACRLLQTSTLSMKEIATRAGFTSPSRFDRDFKNVCGVSPSTYRANLWRHPNPFNQS